VLEGLSAVCAEGELGERARALGRGCVHWLGQAQNNDGGWGGDRGIESSVEETALAVEALATAPAARIPRDNEGLDRGVNWLLDRVESGSWLEPSPIGFYFAKLWYFERLYPVIFTVGALSAAAKGLDADRETGSVKISTTNSA
jgi:squalene-hopene/tetraprenyl-beta-curcumene cyclase